MYGGNMYLDKLLTIINDGTLFNLTMDDSRWDSLIVNKRKPHTYRVFTYLSTGERICLHRFDECDDTESFIHPHPWPGAFVILEGGYEMSLWISDNREDMPHFVCNTVLNKGSSYEILNPLTWHGVTPLVTTYTVMMNGEPWGPDIAHTKVRTTAGKDLDKMPKEMLIDHLSKFQLLL